MDDTARIDQLEDRFCALEAKLDAQGAAIHAIEVANAGARERERSSEAMMTEIKKMFENNANDFRESIDSVNASLSKKIADLEGKPSKLIDSLKTAFLVAIAGGAAGSVYGIVKAAVTVYIQNKPHP